MPLRQRAIDFLESLVTDFLTQLATSHQSILSLEDSPLKSPSKRSTKRKTCEDEDEQIQLQKTTCINGMDQAALQDGETSDKRCDASGSSSEESPEGIVIRLKNRRTGLGTRSS